MWWKATIVCIFSLLACAYAPGGHHTHLCLTCDHLTNPHQCHVYQNCHHGEHCSTEVRFENNHYIYKLGCKSGHDCPVMMIPVGKRAGHTHGQIVCSQCCDVTGCNKDLCGSYRQPTTTEATTVAGTTQTQASATTSNVCQDFEDESFRCADYDKYHLCDADGGLSYELGHQRCQKHCGFCNTNGTLSNFVTRLDTSSKATTMDQSSAQVMTSLPSVITSQTKTSPPVSSITTTVTIPPVTSLPPALFTTVLKTTLPPALNTLPAAANTTRMTSVPPAANTMTTTQVFTTKQIVPINNTAAWVPIAANISVGQATTFPVVCRDFEDATFTCAEWASHGFCQMSTGGSTGQGYEIAKLRCAKYCGFCH